MKVAGARIPEARLGLFALALGALVVFGVQTALPVGVPLYDGVVVQEPYRFLHPTGDQLGGPTSYEGDKAVDGDLSPIFAAATSENPPQAQLISQRGAFTLSPGATSLHVSIAPIEPPPPPPGGTIAGNAYVFTVTDQSQQRLEVRQCSGCLSLLLRAPDGTGEAVVKRFANGEWRDVETVHAGMVGLFQTNPTEMGTYAVIAVNEVAPSDVFGFDPIILIGGGIAIVLLLIGIVVLLRVRPAPGEPEPAPRTRIPSKRKAPRR